MRDSRYVRGLEEREGLFPLGGIVPPERREVHITDMQTYMLCRQKWDFSSLLRRGLQPSLLPAPLFLGQGVHLGLDYGYRNSLEEGKSMTFNLQAALKAFNNWSSKRLASMTETSGQLWEDEAETYNSLLTLGRVMLTHYSLWAKQVDRQFIVRGLEKIFSVNVPSSLRVAYGGRFDGLLESKATGELYILEFKTSRSTTKKSLAPIFRSMQSTAYLWAARKVYQEQVSGVLYRVLWKKMPDIPKLVRNGARFSYAKSQHMTEVWLDHTLEQMAEGDPDAFHELRARAGSLREMIREQAYKNVFFKQQLIQRSGDQIEHMLHVLRTVGREMTQPGVPIFPMPGYHCSWCRFQDVCDLIQYGHKEAAEDLLSVEFAPRSYWESDDDD